MRRLWRRCRPARSGGHRPGTACRFTSCSARNCTTGRAIPMATNPGATGRTTTSASAGLPPPPPSLPRAPWTRIGQRTWSMPTTGRPRWRRPISPGSGSKVPSILTIHNLAYQGLFPRDSLRRIGAPESSFHIDGLEFYDQLSFLKGGLVYASHLTTVSATYAREITTRELGCGLEGLLQRRSDAAQLTGILNGIDESWDPRACAQLAQTVRRRRLGRQAGQRRLRPQAVRPGAVARSDVRPCRPPGAPEGRRPRAVRRRRDHRGRRTDRGDRQRRGRRSSRRWSMRTAAGRTRSASPSASTTPRRGGFLPAAISR